MPIARARDEMTPTRRLVCDECVRTTGRSDAVERMPSRRPAFTCNEEIAEGLCSTEAHYTISTSSVTATDLGARLLMAALAVDPQPRSSLHIAE